MKKIILDTNFLLIPFQFRIDIFEDIKRIMTEPYELYVLDQTLEELDKIAKEQNGKNKESAKMAKQLIGSKAKILKGDKDYADDSIVSLADINTLVGTQDRQLKKRVKEKGSKTIVMRQKQYLKIE